MQHYKLLALFILLFALMGCQNNDAASEHFTESGTDLDCSYYTLVIPDEEQALIINQCLETALLYKHIVESSGILSDNQIQQAISLLGEQGYCVTEINNKTDMQNPDTLALFCHQVEQNEKTNSTYYTVSANGTLQRTDLVYEKGTMQATICTVKWNEDTKPECDGIKRYDINKWNITEKGYFMFERYIPDGMSHVASYTAIRIKPHSGFYRELAETYLEPIGYKYHNLFTTSWNQDMCSDLIYNDLYEYFYHVSYGRWLADYDYPDGIPADEFESLIGHYLALTAEQIRAYSLFNETADSYLWHARTYREASSQSQIIPEVTGYQENNNGTITLTIDAVWPEYLTDKAFTHRLTLLCREDGSWQYIANDIIPDDLNQFPYYPPRLYEESR